MIECPGGIASAAYAGYHIIGILSAYVFFELLLYLLAYDGLEIGDHLRVGVRTHCAAYHIEAVGVAAPCSYRLVGGILECHVA